MKGIGAAFPAVLLAGAAPSVSPAPRIAIKALAALPSIRDPQLSPAGSLVAARVDIAGEEQLAVFDAANAEKRPRTVTLGKADLRWFSWAGDDRLLLGLGLKSKVMGIEVPITRVIAVDLATQASRVIGKRRGMVGDDVIFTDPGGRYILLSSQPDLFSYPAVDRINLATAETEEVQKPIEGVWNWFADNQGVVRAGVEYGEKRYKIYYREAAAAPLRRARPRHTSRTTASSTRCGSSAETKA